MTTPRTENNGRESETPAPSERIMTVNEAAEAYPDEWIFMKVMEQNEHGHAAAGIVVAHHRTRDGIQPVMMDTFVHNPVEHPLGFYSYNGLRFKTRPEAEAYRVGKREKRDRGA